MSKSLYKVSQGLAHVITTGEPVFIKSFSTSFNPTLKVTEEVAIVVRPVATQNGIEYRQEQIPVEELETPQGLVKRKISYDEFVQKAREESESRRYELSKASTLMLQKAIQATKPLNTGVANA